jgi:hypothetical protein
MAIKQTTIKIGDEDFLITSMPATKGIKVLKQLTKLIGPAFSELIKGEQAGVNPVSVAMEKLFDNLDQVEIENLVKDLVSSATKGSITINFDSEFSGDYAKLFTLAKEIVEFNYGSVFTLLGLEPEAQA